MQLLLGVKFGPVDPGATAPCLRQVCPSKQTLVPIPNIAAAEQKFAMTAAPRLHFPLRSPNLSALARRPGTNRAELHHQNLKPSPAIRAWTANRGGLATLDASALKLAAHGAAGVAALDGFVSLVGRELRCGRASHRRHWRVRPSCVRTQISSRSNSAKPPMGHAWMPTCSVLASGRDDVL